MVYQTWAARLNHEAKHHRRQVPLLLGSQLHSTCKLHAPPLTDLSHTNQASYLVGFNSLHEEIRNPEGKEKVSGTLLFFPSVLL